MYPLFESKWYGYLALTFLSIHTITMIPYHQVSQVSQGLFLLLSLPLLVLKRKTIFRDPMVIALGGVLIIQILSWANSYFNYPEFASSGPKLDRLAKLFSFVFIAYWLKGKVTNIYLLLTCYLVSIILAFLSYPNFLNDFIRGWNGARVDFGMKNAQYTSMFGGMGLLIGAFLIFHINRYKTYPQPYVRFGLSVLSLVACSFFFSLLVISQSRQAWTALSLALLILPLFAKVTFPQIKTKFVLSTYLVIGLALFSFSQMDIIQQRTSVESGTLSAILRGDFNNIPMSSIGIRVNSWIAALDWIKANPLIGADSNAISEVIAQSPKFIAAKITGFGHLHNYHLETLVAYGVLGLITLYFVYYWSIASTFKASKLNPDARPFTLLAMAFLVFWVVINCFETFSGRRYGVFTHNVLFGCCYTFYLTQSLRKKESTKE